MPASRVVTVLVWLVPALSLAWIALLWPASAIADTLGQIDVVEEGPNAVIRIGFNVRVQYLRHAPTDGGDLLQVFFQVIGDGEGPSVVPEFRRSRPNSLYPGFTVTYPLQPTQIVKKLVIRFKKPVKFKVRPGSDPYYLEVVLAQAAARQAETSPLPAAQTPDISTPAPVPSIERASANYVVVLDTFPSGDVSRAPVLPAQFSDYAVFPVKITRDGKTAYQLQLGYFDTESAAEQARKQLLSRFPNARVVELALARAPTPPQVVAPPARVAAPPAQVAPPPVSGAAHVPEVPRTQAPAPPQPPAKPAEGPVSDLEQRAANLLAKGQAALAANDNAAAIDAFNQLLFLPPNKASQEAQELVGVARERNGEVVKAKAEYELYLKVYPDGDGAKRVRERLAGLGTASLTPSAGRQPGAPRPTLRTISGSVAQYYYDGTTRSATAFNTPTTVDRSTLASKDLSALVTNVDLIARVRTEDADTRVIIRNTNSYSFLDTTPNENNLSAAYVDYRGLRTPLMVRAGRQSGISGGVSGRFDGVLAGYAFVPKWRVNAVGGMPSDYGIDSTRYFYGLSVDAEGLAERWSGSLYALNQVVDGVTDRRPVGAELRYVDPFRSVYSLFEYDVWFNQVNIAMFQGTWQTPGRTAFNVLLDRRKAPPLATSNSVIGQPSTSVKTLLQTQSLAQLRAQAAALTADVTQVLASVTTPVGLSWQLGADFRLTNVGALPAVGDIPATPATGNIYGYTVQAIGNNLYSGRDINVFSGTFLTGPTYDGVYLAYNNLTALNGVWTLEPSLKLYFQQDTLDVKLRRVTPGLRLTYRVRDGIALEGEYIYEQAHTKSAAQQDDSTHQFFYVGYRVDF